MALRVLLAVVVPAVVVLAASPACGPTSPPDRPPVAFQAEPTPTPAPAKSATLAVPTQIPTPAPTQALTLAPTPTATPEPVVVTGAQALAESEFAPLAGQRVGLIVNQTSMVGVDHLVDLVADSPGVELVAIFAPEHGIRGTAGAGELVESEVDPATGVPIHSLYGQHRAPTAAMLAGIDVLVYDIQDVGARYYTYISTMGLAMAAAAEAGLGFVVLDRPSPQSGGHVSGHIAGPGQRSFVSQYPIPATYAMTAGELARAIVGEAWLPGVADLDLTVIQVAGWDRGRSRRETEWIAPSPGLPTLESALIYPATVLFEATTLSYGRGTPEPFTLVGAPWLDGVDLAARLGEVGFPGVSVRPVKFVPSAEPTPNPQSAQSTQSIQSIQWQGVEVSGVAITVTDPDRFDATEFGVHLLTTVRDLAAGAGVGEIINRPEMFDLLAGSDELRVGLEQGSSAAELIGRWQADLDAFAPIRARYLIYPD